MVHTSNPPFQNHTPPAGVERPVTVLVAGAGGLGSGIILALADNCHCRLIIVDQDRVETTNLNRQILHPDHQVGLPKAHSALISLERLFPRLFGGDKEAMPIGIMGTMDHSNVDHLLQGLEVDLVVDGTDNFQTRFILNDPCVRLGIPFIHGGVLGTAGQAFTVLPGLTPCYRCVLGQIPPPGQTPTAREVGILGAAAGFMGGVEAGEALNLVPKLKGINRGFREWAWGDRSPLTGNMLMWDGLSSTTRILTIPGPPSCRVCEEAGRGEGRWNAPIGTVGTLFNNKLSKILAQMREKGGGWVWEEEGPRPVILDLNRPAGPPPESGNGPREPAGERYARNVRLPWLGLTGQTKLLNGEVTMVINGKSAQAGWTGAAYLCAAGVGKVNLLTTGHHETGDPAGTTLAPESIQYLRDLNPDSTVTCSRAPNTPNSSSGQTLVVDMEKEMETTPPEMGKLNLPAQAVGALAALEAIKKIVDP